MKISGAIGLALALTSVGLASAPAAIAQSNKAITVAPPAGAPMSFADLVDQVSPAVVSIEVVTEIDVSRLQERLNPFRGLPGFDEFQNEDQEDGEEERRPERNREGRSLGSGFFITGDGYVVTNHHVIENAREVVVVLNDGDEFEAEIIGSDEATDLAVLKVKRSGQYPHVNFVTNNKPRVGDWVVAVGNPFGLGGTATAGIVSADGRTLDGVTYNDFIQVDASINRGNSGGPTFNLNGEVIGVNTAIFSETGGSVGIGFAIQASMAKKITDVLIKDGKVTRGWLGVEIQNLSPRFAEAWGIANEKGAVVSRVTDGGPAESSGIKREDVIIAVNDEEVSDRRDLTRKVGGLLAGSRNSFKLIRDGKEQTIWVTVAERGAGLGAAQPSSSENEFVRPEEMDGDVEILGATVRAFGAEDQKRFAYADEEAGLLVVTVESDGALDESGINPGDALLTANGKDLATPADLEKVIADAKSAGKEDVVMLVGFCNREFCGERALLLPVKIR